LQIPYDTGMSPYSGFFDLIEKKAFVVKEGNRYVYTDLHGEMHKYFRKQWNKNEDGIMDLVMAEFDQKIKLQDAADAVESESVEEM
jgi:hypothetical protein